MRTAIVKGASPPLSFGSFYVNGDRHRLRGGHTTTVEVPGGDVRALIVFSWYRCGLWVGSADAKTSMVLEYWHRDITDVGAGRAPVDALSVGQSELVNTHSAERLPTWRRIAALFMALLVVQAAVLAVSDVVGLAAGLAVVAMLPVLGAAGCIWVASSRRKGRRLTTIPHTPSR